MSFTCGFFNSKNTDRVYSAEDFTSYLSSLICDGILDTYGDNFSVTKKSDTEIAVGTGKAWIGGHYLINDSEYVIDMSTYTDASLDRFVVLAVCCDVNESVRDCHLEIIPCTPSSSPVIVFPVNGGGKTYLTLAAVRIKAASDSPVGTIYDYRDDESKCGYCKCILGKCKVTEMLSQMTDILTQLEQYKQTVKSLETDILSIKRRLGMVKYTYPDVNGDGEVGADDSQRLNEFLAKLGAGEYAEYDTIEEKWNAYAAENGLENSQYISDVNGDGEMRADDVADILGYISDAGAGKYPNSEEGFRDYMLDKYQAIFGSNVTGIRVVTQEYYEQLEKKPDMLYAISEEESP